MPLPTPEARLAGQISSLSDTVERLLSLAEEAGAKNADATDRRHRELDKAMKIVDRSTNLAVALSKLRGGTFNFNIRRETGPALTAEQIEAARIAAIEAEIDAEMDRDLGPAFTPQEFSTITHEELRLRCDKRWAERNLRRAARGLPVWSDEDPATPALAATASAIAREAGANAPSPEN